MDHITCNDCGEQAHYSGNSGFPTEAKLKEYVQSFRNMNQEKSFNKPPGGGYQKALVNVKDASRSLMMGPPTEEWGKLPYTGLRL